MKNILYTLRKEKGLTQEKVAQYLNTVHSSYNRMENNDIEKISSEYLKKLSTLYNVSIDYLLGQENNKKERGIQIPVLGTIPAGIPIEAIEEILDYEEIPQSMAQKGDYFGLKVRGDSMAPRIQSGDIVIVRKQETAESGDICVIMVNGFDATLKQIKRDYNGISLVPFNPDYKPMFYSNKDIEELPIKIIGKVIELRGKF